MHPIKTSVPDQSSLSEFLRLFRDVFSIFSWFLTSLALVYLLNRISFSFYHVEKLQELSAIDWVVLYLNAFRFDLATMAPFFLLFLMTIFIPFRSIRNFQWWGLTIVVLVFILLNGADTVLIEFTGRRFSKSSLMLVGEGNWSNLLQFAVMSGVTFCLIVIGFYGSYRSFLRLQKIEIRAIWYQKIIFTSISLILSVLLARGGLQLKPISFVDAKVVDHPFAHQVVLNSTFTFLTSLGKKPMPKHKYFPEAEVTHHLNLNGGMYTRKNFELSPDTNLIVFILESYSQEYFTEQATPFLKSLETNNAAFFPKAYANGRRSIEGIAALFAGIPALMEDPFINSEYATNEFIGLGQLFKNKNYHTSFFHGAQNGSMRFDQFTKTAGFDHYFGKNEYLNEIADGNKDDDGTWGIFDEPFLLWSCEKQSTFPTPFVTSVFTLTSHHPFKTPTEFINPGRDVVLNSIAYTDHALKKYFECAKTKPWFEKTLFVFIGDHTGPTLKENANFADLFHVVMGFYSPKQDLRSTLESDRQFAQQIDLLPTLDAMFKLGLKNTNHLSRSLLLPGKKSIALYSDQRWEMVGDAPDLENSMKATKQYFSEAMVDNRLYYPAQNK